MLLALSLMARVGVPTGWMPSGERAFAVKICAGIEMQTAWLDRDGKLHKTDPSKKDHEGENKQDCAFAGLASHAVLGNEGAVALVRPFPFGATVSQPAAASIGNGLAAPPPPATGPPSLT